MHLGDAVLLRDNCEARVDTNANRGPCDSRLASLVHESVDFRLNSQTTQEGSTRVVLVRDWISEISIQRSVNVDPRRAAESLDLTLPDRAVLLAELQQVFGIEAAGHVSEAVHLAEDDRDLPALFRRRRRARTAHACACGVHGSSGWRRVAWHSRRRQITP